MSHASTGWLRPSRSFEIKATPRFEPWANTGEVDCSRALPSFGPPLQHRALTVGFVTNLGSALIELESHEGTPPAPNQRLLLDWAAPDGSVPTLVVYGMALWI